MVARPEEAIASPPDANEVESHRRSHRDINSLAGVFCEEFVEFGFLIRDRDVAPIVKLNLWLEVFQHHLNRMLDLLPTHDAAEHRMAAEGCLPRAPEVAVIDPTSKQTAHLEVSGVLLQVLKPVQ